MPKPVRGNTTTVGMQQIFAPRRRDGSLLEEDPEKTLGLRERNKSGGFFRAELEESNWGGLPYAGKDFKTSPPVEELFDAWSKVKKTKGPEKDNWTNAWTNVNTTTCAFRSTGGEMKKAKAYFNVRGNNNQVVPRTPATPLMTREEIMCEGQREIEISDIANDPYLNIRIAQMAYKRDVRPEPKPLRSHQMKRILTNAINPLDSCAALRLRKENGAHFRSAVKDRKSWDADHYRLIKRHGPSHIHPKMRQAGKDFMTTPPVSEVLGHMKNVVMVPRGKATRHRKLNGECYRPDADDDLILDGIADLSYNPRAVNNRPPNRAKPWDSDPHYRPPVIVVKGNSTTVGLKKSLDQRNRDGTRIVQKERCLAVRGRHHCGGFWTELKHKMDVTKMDIAGNPSDLHLQKFKHLHAHKKTGQSKLHEVHKRAPWMKIG